MVGTIVGVIAVIAVVLVAILFLGMRGGDDTPNHVVDTDGDGYSDEVDDFPNDSRYHEKKLEYSAERGASWLWGRDHPTFTLCHPCHTSSDLLIVGIYTSGGDLLVEFYDGDPSQYNDFWHYYYNGMDETENEWWVDLYDFDLDYVVLSDPTCDENCPGHGFGWQVFVYSVR